jgi:hypothetical protein
MDWIRLEVEGGGVGNLYCDGLAVGCGDATARKGDCADDASHVGGDSIGPDDQERKQWNFVTRKYLLIQSTTFSTTQLIGRVAAVVVVGTYAIRYTKS